MIHVLLFYLVLLVACGYAGLRGGAPERIAAGILVAGTIATWCVGIAARGYSGGQFHQQEFGILAVDTVMLLALVALALAADRYWPLWLSALQAFGVVAHVAKALAPDILAWVYLTAHAFSAYPGLILLALGTGRHRRRLIRTGFDPSWSTFSPSSIPAWRWSGPTG